MGTLEVHSGGPTALLTGGLVGWVCAVRAIPRARDRRARESPRPRGAAHRIGGNDATWQVWLRSELPHTLSAAGLQEFLDLGIGAVIDLRTTSERVHRPSPLVDAGVPTAHAPDLHR